MLEKIEKQIHSGHSSILHQIATQKNPESEKKIKISLINQKILDNKILHGFCGVTLKYQIAMSSVILIQAKNAVNMTKSFFNSSLTKFEEVKNIS